MSSLEGNRVIRSNTEQIHYIDTRSTPLAYISLGIPQGKTPFKTAINYVTNLFCLGYNNVKYVLGWKNKAIEHAVVRVDNLLFDPHLSVDHSPYYFSIAEEINYSTLSEILIRIDLTEPRLAFWKVPPDS